MEWQVCMGFAYLIVISVILWGASQGFYSKKIVTRPTDVATASVETCEKYTSEIDRLKGKIFEQSLELDKKTAKIAELTRDANELMDSVNSLTTRLQEAEAANARMATALKNALGDLQSRSRQLQECTAKLLARQIVNEKCHMVPENANLLR